MKRKFTIFAVSILFFIPLLPTISTEAFSPLSAACSSSAAASKASVCSQTNQSPIYGPNSILDKVINLISVIVGIVAVFAVIVAGLMLITSGGESAKVSTAKNTIIYVAIGLVVVGFAQLIEAFVINNL